MKKTKVLICGVTGFIGRNIADRLVERPDLEIHGTYFKTEPAPELQKNIKITLRRADLTERQQVNDVVRGMDVIIQAAAVTSGAKDIVSRPYIHTTDNAVMNSFLLRAAYEQEVKHLVFFSCTTMYTPGPEPVAEDDFDHEITPKYFGVGWTKVYIEKMCEFYARLGRTRHTAIRHSNIYGPYDKYDLDRSHVFGATVTKVMTNKTGTLDVWGDGSEKRDLLHVNDLVDFVELVIQKQKEPFELLNLGAGSSISIRDLVNKIIQHSGKNIQVRYDVSKPTIGFNIELDVNAARERFGWMPRVPLDDGIREALEWYRKTFSDCTP
jgi:nucleoside-diphosphate-sugar epimerase